MIRQYQRRFLTVAGKAWIASNDRKRPATGVILQTRRHTFTGVGRYPETLQSASADLNPEGTDYVLQPDTPAPHPPLLATLQALLTESPTPLTRRELLDRWPGPAPRPDSLWRTLARGIELCLFTATGKGTKTEPFRFGVVRGAEAGEVTFDPKGPKQNSPEQSTAMPELL